MPSILFFLRMNHKATRPAAPTTNIPITVAGSGVEFPAMSSPRILIECEGFFKDGTEVDDPRTELDENELLSPSNASAVFIKEFCLTIFYTFLGVTLSSYIFDVWL